MAASGLAMVPSLSWGSSRASAGPTVGLLQDVTLPWGDDAPALRARLLANENPYGPSEAVRGAIAEAVGLGNRYGHEDAARLIDRIAEKEGVTKDHIMLGPGSTDLLEKTAIACFLQGGNLVSADPSYMSIINTAKAIGAEWRPVPLTADHAHDLKAMAAAVDAQTKLVYVCNPNNPLGSLTPQAGLRQFCSEVSDRVPVFVDEAYVEFLDNPAGNTVVGLVAQGKDVIVARTFSKIHGMAGLRIGYIVAQPERISQLSAMVRSTFGLCVTSVCGALASLQDAAFTERCHRLNLECRAYVSHELKALGYPYIPSVTNFVIFPIRGEAPAFQQSLRNEGVGIRMFEIGGKPWCRVSVGTMAEMQLFVEALKKVSV